MSNLPVRREPQMGVIPRTMGELDQLARACVASGFFADAQQAGQALIKIQAGAELGLPPVQSMTSINVIKGRITLSAGLMAALIKRAGYRIRVKWTDNPLCCNVSVFEGAELVGESTFSTQDARTAGLGGANWQKYPRNMLYARAISNAARWYTPEVLTGVYLPDELEDAPQDLQPAQPVVVAAPNAPARDRTRDSAAPERCPDCGATISSGDCDCAPADVVQPKPTKDRNHYMKKLHAIGKEAGLSHDELRGLVGVASLSDASADLLEWASSMLGAQDVDELRFAWDRTPMPLRPQLTSLKEWCKAHLPGGAS